MIARILGIIWIFLGGLWLIWPQMLRRRLSRKMNRKLRWTVYGLILMLVFFLLGLVAKAEGLLLKGIGLLAILVAVRIILLLSAKTSAKMGEFWANKPLLYFRLWGLVILIIGLSLILA